MVARVTDSASLSQVPLFFLTSASILSSDTGTLVLSHRQYMYLMLVDKLMVCNHECYRCDEVVY